MREAQGAQETPVKETAPANKAQGRPKRKGLKGSLHRAYELLGLSVFAVATVSLLGLAGLSIGDVGTFVAEHLRYTLGIGSWPFAVLLLLIGWQYLTKHHGLSYSLAFLRTLALFILALAIYHHFQIPVGEETLPQSYETGGGLLGGGLLFLLRKYIGVQGALVVLCLLFVLLAFTPLCWHVLQARRLKERALREKRRQQMRARIRIDSLLGNEPLGKVRNSFYNQEDDAEFPAEEEGVTLPPLPQKSMDVTAFTPKQFQRATRDEKNEETKPTEQKTTPEETKETPPVAPEIPYALPDLKNILLPKEPEESAKVQEAETIERADALARALKKLKAQAKIVGAYRGPTLTRYEAELAPGTKARQLSQVTKDLAQELGVFSVRVGSIPNKAALGLEVPNRSPRIVRLREILEEPKFRQSPSKLLFGLGIGIGGQAVFVDFRDVSHILLAGTARAGKSVFLQSMLTSLLLKARPDELKLLLIDPRQKSLPIFDGIPHLLGPTVTDTNEAKDALTWAAEEVRRRHHVLTQCGTRDWLRFNQQHPQDKLPAIVIVVDELSDLMLAFPQEVEGALYRLAQKAKGTGIHLLLATQRPSLDTFTSLIKANIPSRIAMALPSEVTSRAILDTTGAEKLLGRGDMLYRPVGATRPLRVQGAFVSTEEITKLLDFVHAQIQRESA